MRKYETAFMVKYLPPTDFKGSRISIKNMYIDSKSRWLIAMDYSFPMLIDQAKEFISKDLSCEIISTIPVKGGYLITASIKVGIL